MNTTLCDCCHRDISGATHAVLAFNCEVRQYCSECAQAILTFISDFEQVGDGHEQGAVKHLRQWWGDEE